MPPEVNVKHLIFLSQRREIKKYICILYIYNKVSVFIFFFFYFKDISLTIGSTSVRRLFYAAILGTWFDILYKNAFNLRRYQKPFKMSFLTPSPPKKNCFFTFSSREGYVQPFKMYFLIKKELSLFFCFVLLLLFFFYLLHKGIDSVDLLSKYLRQHLLTISLFVSIYWWFKNRDTCRCRYKL